jgi:hypothetical protein
MSRFSFSSFFLVRPWFGLLFLGHEPFAQRGLALAHIREECPMSKLCFAASFSRVRWTSATIGSSHMTLCSHEFFGRADDRHLLPQFLAHQCYSPCHLRGCQVLAIPGRQIVNGVNRRHGNVERENEGIPPPGVGRTHRNLFLSRFGHFG